MCRTKNCGKCGDALHDTKECTNQISCINCSGGHPAYDRNCPIYIKEKLIEKIRSQNKVSYKQAELTYNTLQPPKPLISYAKITTALTPSSTVTTNNLTVAPTQINDDKTFPHLKTGSQEEATYQSITQPLYQDQLSKLTNLVESLIKRIDKLESKITPNDITNDTLISPALSTKSELVAPLKIKLSKINPPTSKKKPTTPTINPQQKRQRPSSQNSTCSSTDLHSIPETLNKSQSNISSKKIRENVNN